MKNQTILLCLLLVLSLFLTACQRDAGAAAEAASTESAFGETLSEAHLDAFHIELPEGMERSRNTAAEDVLYRDGKIVGGILILDVSLEGAEDPHSSGELETYLHNTVMPSIDPREDGYEYMLSYGSLSHVAATGAFYTMGDRIEYMHYICLGEEVVYDLWLNGTVLGEEIDHAISRSITIG